MTRRFRAILRVVASAMRGCRTQSSTVCLMILALSLVACGGVRRQPPSSPATLPPGARLVSLSFTDRDHGWVVAADCGEAASTPTSACRALLYASSDGGRSWSPGARILVAPRKLQFTDRSTGWLIGSIGRECGNSTCPNVVMRTLDGGRTWERASTTSAELVDLSFTSPRDGWVLGEDCAMRLACTPIVVSTKSGGQTWTNQELPLTGHAFRVGRVSPATGWVGGMVAGHAVLLATRDDGARWDQLETPCHGNALAFSFRSPEHGWLYCSGRSEAGPADGSVYRTDDGGRSWQALGQLVEPATAENVRVETAIEALSTDDGWVLDEGGTVHTTHDGGKTWSQAPSPGTSLSAMLFVDTSHGWLIGDQAIWRTTNAGRTWERISLSAT